MGTRRLSVVGLGVVVVSLLGTPAARAEPTCFGHEATITDGNQGNTIYGTPGDDVIVARRGKDRIFARGGDDIVCGGNDNDRIRGGRGADVIVGGQGNDVPFRSNRRPDFRGGLSGNRGHDVVFGSNGIDLVRGGPGDDVVRGGPSEDNDISVAGTFQAGSRRAGTPSGGGGYRASWGGMVHGGRGDDHLRGGSGLDLLDSRDDVVGNDRLNGGRDDDTCRSDPDPERSC